MNARECGGNIGDRRLFVLSANDHDWPWSHRTREARLAADEDCDQRHTQRRGEMKQPGIHPDNKGRASDETGHPIERGARSPGLSLATDGRYAARNVPGFPYTILVHHTITATCKLFTYPPAPRGQ